jgi:hypothetical protein
MYTMTLEITDADRDQAMRLAEELDGAIGPATRLRILERGTGPSDEQSRLPTS